MFNATTAKKSSSGHAIIRDGALILSLETAEVPLVARFDLDSLAQANFIVQSFDKFHQLSLRDFSGQIQPIAQFPNKMDAHQALHHILQALVEHGQPAKNQNHKITFGTVIGWILKLLGVTFIVTLLYATYLYRGQALPHLGGAAQTQTTSLPDLNVPEGEPQDVDNLFAQPKAEQQ